MFRQAQYDSKCHSEWSVSEMKNLRFFGKFYITINSRRYFSMFFLSFRGIYFYVVKIFMLQIRCDPETSSG